MGWACSSHEASIPSTLTHSICSLLKLTACHFWLIPLPRTTPPLTPITTGLYIKWQHSMLALRSQRFQSPKLYTPGFGDYSPVPLPAGERPQTPLAFIIFRQALLLPLSLLETFWWSPCPGGLLASQGGIEADQSMGARFRRPLLYICQGHDHYLRKEGKVMPIRRRLKHQALACFRTAGAVSPPGGPLFLHTSRSELSIWSICR